jgi:hypothetical protein
MSSPLSQDAPQPTADRSLAKGWRAGPRSRLGQRQGYADAESLLIEMNPVVSTASNELCSEARGRLVERLDGPIGTGEHHAALKRGHDMKGSRFRGRAPDPMRKIINAATEKGLDFFSDFGRQNAGLGAQDAKEAHLTILIESRSKTPIGRGL